MAILTLNTTACGLGIIVTPASIEDRKFLSKNPGKHPLRCERRLARSGLVNEVPFLKVPLQTKRTHT
jgi:hypothetical protein